MKKEGLLISDGYFGEGMKTNSAGEKGKKERNNEIFFKNYVYNVYTQYVTLFLVFVRLPIYCLLFDTVFYPILIS